MSAYSIDEARLLLARTPSILRAILKGLPDSWLLFRERPDAWTAKDVVGHLIHGEDTDWIPRAQIILSRGEETPFPPFDQHGHVTKYAHLSLSELLDLFEHQRGERLREFESMNLSETDLDKTGIHPAFGKVTLRQHLSTWVAHDLNHLGQVSRILAHRYSEDVGPWKEYLAIMRDTTATGKS